LSNAFNSDFNKNQKWGYKIPLTLSLSLKGRGDMNHTSPPLKLRGGKEGLFSTLESITSLS
jgi:hypothetical protein